MRIMFVNSFEIAILRILVKMQKPVSIPFLVEGFPNNSEDFVLWAIGNLLKSGFISYLDNQKRDCIIYNKQRRKEILKIIDPLPDLETEPGQLFSIPKQELKEQKPVLTTDRRRGTSNKRLYSLHKHPYHTRIALAISILSIGSVIILGSMTPTSSIYRHLGLLGAYYHHNYYPSYNMAVYYDQLGNHSLYNPKFLKTEEITSGNSILLYLPHESSQSCNV
jgi:hypothetical protein